MKNNNTTIFLLSLVISFALTCAGIDICNAKVAPASTMEKNKADINKYDSIIYIVAKNANIDPVLLKAHCMKESSMREGVTRNEDGYITGRYMASSKKIAWTLKRYANEWYGSDQSVETWVFDLSKSYGLAQIMGAKAFELGWRGYSFLDPDEGLVNARIALSFGAKLMAMNIKRYGGDLPKAISAYNAGSYTPRNKSYVTDVLGYMNRFKNDFARFEK